VDLCTFVLKLIIDMLVCLFKFRRSNCLKMLWLKMNFQSKYGVYS
jgi:hypothetical protein